MKICYIYDIFVKIIFEQIFYLLNNMEILLLILIFLYLFSISSTIRSQFSGLYDRLDTLERAIQSQKTLQSAWNTEKEPIIEVRPPTPVWVAPPMPTIPIQPPPVKVFEPVLEPQFAFESNDSSLDPPEKSWWDNFKEDNPDLEKFIGENLINKIGIVILVLGISYFVKFSIDKGWINEPTRVGIGILAGALVMAVAHKLRQQYAAFSSVFVAGAIAIFYFTIGIAFHSYHLFSQSVAFALMVGITAFSCFVSLAYDRKELAVLSLIGGFAVPFMVSTGQGNYIALFTYITILDLGILALAYRKQWSIVYILSYIFTVLLYGGWLLKDINAAHPHYLGTLAFGFGFYLIFVGMNLVHSVRSKGKLSQLELGILSSNTFLFFGAGMLLLKNYHPELKGLFSISLSLFNLLYAWFLHKKLDLDKNAAYLFIGMALTFVTLAIPIQFEGNYITLFWSAEAVMLMWLGQKSKLTGYRLGSVIVTVLMLASLLLDWAEHYGNAHEATILFNKICITGLFSVLSLAAIYYLLKDETEEQILFGIHFNPMNYRAGIRVAAILTTYFVGLLEVTSQANHHIKGVPTGICFAIFYHLLFNAIVFFGLCRSKSPIRYNIAAFIGIINIVLFTFWFSNYPFYEHADNLAGNIHQRLGFILHYFSLGLVIYLGIRLYQNYSETPFWESFDAKIILWIASFLIVHVASSELMLHGLVLSATKTHIIQTGFPILWGILAFIALIVGIKMQHKTLRIIALTLLGITILKLFLYDIRNASETGKIIAFILLGVLILIISFVYQKIKVLMLEDKES